MTLLYLTRHGETDDNARGVFHGQGGHGLNVRGRNQARRLAERLARVGASSLVASDLERAEETARAVGTACALEVTLDRDLREVDVGTWTGKSHEELAALYPEEWSAWSTGIDVRRGGGETYGELALRVERGVIRACERAGGAANPSIVLVSHGGAIKSYVAKILHLGAEGMRALGGIGNAGITILERDARGRVRLHAWNDTSHLDALDALDT